ncbi:ATP-binding protein [Chitinasiproducens palmae]|uniref:histidine kinase n=1 Tax=Chitinasiproducens palmae TaxID=1770053 RepID=A0A1H2PKP1_9BURK|nr:ATP-binding protein [Chitinasiproducens palmae]SDV47016.1 PAS domain S-box-containing protein [Chitinasiproducens palmae]
MTFPSPSQFRQMFDALDQCVLLHDADTKAIVWANQAACRALGYRLDELLPLKANDMTRQDPRYLRQIAIDAMDRSKNDGPQAYEWCYRSRAGTEMLSEAVATFVPLRGRDVVMVQFRDISAEEAMRQKLRSYEARLREYMLDLAEGVALLTPAGKVAFISESGRRALGISQTDRLNRLRDFCSPAEREQFAQQLGSADPRHTSEPCRYRVLRRDGTERCFSVTCRRVAIDRQLTGVLVHFRDISDEVALEEARRVEARMLEYAGRHNTMGEMATAIAHELSQPLAAVRNYLEGAIRRLRRPGAAQSALFGLQAADRQAEHAAAILKSVREFVGRREPVEARADLRDVLADVAYFIELRARDAGASVRIVQHQEPVWVLCERVLIGQVILNLSFNAVEALSDADCETKTVTLCTSVRDGAAELHVVDNGPGVSDYALGRLFEGFSSSKQGGNGIGLSLCASIVARHNGRIWAQRADGGGLQCCFSLPLDASA